MCYDWHGTNEAGIGSSQFFEEIDKRFFCASPFFGGQRPFSSLIPFEAIAGQRVLEIGCGQGSHTELMARSGAVVTAIDITPQAVELTRRRIELSRLSADVCEMDAEHLSFPDTEFDFIWSWGVIHHSAHTDRIVREVARVLRPGHEFRFMVYHKRSLDSLFKIVRGLLTGKPLRGMSIDEMLSFYTDGYLARFYNREQLRKLIEDNGLKVRKISVLGQTSELLPLPGKGRLGNFKYALVAKVPAPLSKWLLSVAGSFLFAVAYKPDN